MEVVYRDQAVYHKHFLDRCFIAAYTPLGIQRREYGYIRRILDFKGTEEERKELEKEIRDDPHLHKVIKRNLIDNLKDR